MEVHEETGPELPYERTAELSKNRGTVLHDDRVAVFDKKENIELLHEGYNAVLCVDRDFKLPEA